MVTGTDSDNGGNADAKPPSRYTDYFYQVCPFYLSLGMTWDQFWDGDNTMVKYYREAEKIRVENRNTEMWMQGAYIYKVLEAFAPILPAFPKKDAKPGNYLSSPIPFTDRLQQEQKERENKIKSEKDIGAMKSWMERINNKRKQGGEKKWQSPEP